MKDNLQTLLENIGKSRCVVGEAVDGQSEAIAYGMERFGKKVTPRWVRSLNEPGARNRYVFQESYKRIIGGWFYGCRAGAELLRADMEVFLRELWQSFSSPRPMLTDTAGIRDLIMIRNKIDGLLPGGRSTEWAY